MTNNVVNSEHEMSTAKRLCYMAPQALVSKCQPWKMVKNIRPSHPHHHSAAHNIQQILLILVTAIINFLASCSTLKFYEYTMTSVGDCFHYHSVTHNIQGIVLIFCTAIILSGSMNSFDYGVLIPIILDLLEFRNVMNTHWLMFKSGFVTALQLTIFVYPVIICHRYWP